MSNVSDAERSLEHRLDEHDVLVAMLIARTDAMERHLSILEEEADTFLRTPTWKRWLFIADGWSGHKVVDKPRWRPWRRWWRS